MLVTRDVTERAEAVAAGTARLVGTDPDTSIAEASRVLGDEALYTRVSETKNPYGDGRAAERIAEVIANAQ